MEAHRIAERRDGGHSSHAEEGGPRARQIEAERGPAPCARRCREYASAARTRPCRTNLWCWPHATGLVRTAGGLLAAMLRAIHGRAQARRNPKKPLRRLLRLIAERDRRRHQTLMSIAPSSAAALAVDIRGANVSRSALASSSGRHSVAPLRKSPRSISGFPCLPFRIIPCR
jgi:hypothetical protein